MKLFAGRVPAYSRDDLMGKRSNHYDCAFESLLRLMRRPYVWVDEARRTLFRDSSLKSMDFIVYSQQKENLLVDVKGRRFQKGSGTWDSWTPEEDVGSLMHWEGVFGQDFRGIFVFAYELASPREWRHHQLVWEWKQRRYAFYGVYAREYAQVMRSCSPSWQTVRLPAQEFRNLRVPLLDLI